MLPIDAQTLREIAPAFSGQNAIDQKRIMDAVSSALPSVLAQYEIDTPLRIAHFLGQCCEESAGFRTLTEFASGDAYEGRADLGNTAPGDGRRYKGRGLIQITGRANYLRVGQALNLDLVNNPDLAAEPDHALSIACEFWQRNRINVYADRDDVVSVTKVVNGGTNGLADRRSYTSAAKNALARLAALVITGKQMTAPGQDEPVLHRGATGEFVGDLQNHLRTLGYTITVDEDFGPATEAAVRDFQAMHMVPPFEFVPGIVDKQTWAEIDGAINSMHSEVTSKT